MSERVMSEKDKSQFLSELKRELVWMYVRWQLAILPCVFVGWWAWEKSLDVVVVPVALLGVFLLFRLTENVAEQVKFLQFIKQDGVDVDFIPYDDQDPGESPGS